jgi:hypothetical protein
MSMAIGLMAQQNLIDGTALALLGLQWDFKGPVRIGDTSHAVVTPADAEAGARGRLLAIRVKNQSRWDCDTADENEDCVARYREKKLMLAPGSYAEICSRFVWQVPAQFNIGVAVCDRWATGESRPALIHEDRAGNVRTFSFDELKALSDCLANVLAAHGIERGDRVGILLPQCPETVLSHIAIYKMGAVALPLFTQFGPDSAARALVTDGENLPDRRDPIRPPGASGHPRR